MCGISGLLNWSKLQQKAIENVKDSLINMDYRGPDFSDIYIDDKIVLGHNRLSILDINERSNQPMQSKDGKFIIVFNGEIYNFKELKNELVTKGINFRTTSDTEVLLEGYQLFGEKILQKIRGMFSFVIWDVTNQELFAARDRFGEKPFYYFQNKDTFGFASNLSGIVPLCDFDLVINKQAIYELFTYQNIDNKTCIYSGIEKLQPGYYLKLSKHGIETKQYWNPYYKNKIEDSSASIENTIHNLIQSSVEEQLVADVPVGLYLSGGTDSSVIASIASKIKKDVVAYTLTMPGNSKYDETEESKIVSQKLGIKHKLIKLEDSCVNNLPHILKTIEPIADASIIPNMEIAKEAKTNFKVMLSGDGGDDIFGGYKAPLNYFHNSFKGNFLSKKVINTVIENSFNYPFNVLNYKLNDKRIFKWAGIETYYNNHLLFPSVVKKIITQGNYHNNIKNYLSDSNEFCDREEDKLLYVGIKTKLASDYLFKMDAANMFFSVESRAPFLDNRIIDYTSKLSIEQLMPNGIDKEILKNIGAKYLPREFFDLPKKGFSIPYVKYMKNQWGNLLEDFIKEGISSDLGLINSDEVLNYLAVFRKNESNKLGKIMYGLFVFEIWLRVFHLKRNPEEIKLY